MIAGLNAYMPIQIYCVENGWIVDVQPGTGNPFREMAQTMANEIGKDEKLHPPKADDELDPFAAHQPLVFIFKEFYEVLDFLQKSYAP